MLLPSWCIRPDSLLLSSQWPPFPLPPSSPLPSWSPPPLPQPDFPCEAASYCGRQQLLRCKDKKKVLICGATANSLNKWKSMCIFRPFHRTLRCLKGAKMDHPEGLASCKWSSSCWMKIACFRTHMGQFLQDGQSVYKTVEKSWKNQTVWSQQSSKKNKKKGHILTIFPVLGKLTHMCIIWGQTHNQKKNWT